MKQFLLSLFILGAFSGCEEVPSCQQATNHFYEAGCGYVYLKTGKTVPKDVQITDCQKILVAAPENCMGEVDDWLQCQYSVPSPVKSSSDCDCSRERDAMLKCN